MKLFILLFLKLLFAIELAYSQNDSLGVLTTDIIEINNFGEPSIKNKKIDSLYQLLIESSDTTYKLYVKVYEEIKLANKINQEYYNKLISFNSEKLFILLNEFYLNFFEFKLYAYLPGKTNFIWNKYSATNNMETIEIIANQLLLSNYYDKKNRIMEDFSGITDNQYVKEKLILFYNNKQSLINFILNQEISDNKRENLSLILNYLK